MSQFTKTEKTIRFLSLALLLVSGGSWVFFAYRWIAFETSAEAFLLPITATIGSVFSFMEWIKSRSKLALEMRPDMGTVISTSTHTPSALLSWQERIRKTKEITRQYATRHATQNTLIKLGGNIFDAATGTWILGDLTSRGIALSRSVVLLKGLSREVAGIFLAKPDNISETDSLNLSLMQEISDFLVDDFGLELIIETVSDSIADDITDWLPFIRLISSSAFAYAYAWVISLSTVIYIVNHQQLINGQKKDTFQASKNMVKAEFHKIGPIKLFPKKFEEPHWDDLLEIDVLKETNVASIVLLIGEIRKHYPELTQPQIANVLIEKGIPIKLIELATTDENWKKSAPPQLTLMQSIIMVIKDFLTL